MKALVVMNSRGVITLPAKLRAAFGLKANALLIAEATPGGILLRPAQAVPVETYSPERLREFDKGEAEVATALAVRKKRKPK